MGSLVCVYKLCVLCAFLAFLVDIQETLREKSQSLRKHVQENESLEFRNHQLSKRVSLLQEEISSPTSKKKKKVKFSTCLSFCIAVLVVVIGTAFTWILFLPLHPHPPLSCLPPPPPFPAGTRWVCTWCLGNSHSGAGS